MERPRPVAWQPDRLLRVLLTWTSLTTLVFWLPTVRCAFDGRSYEWGLSGMGGAGLSGDYWFPVLGAALACWLVTRGWRGARPPFRWVFPAWHAALAVVITERAIALGDRLTLQLGTLGVIIPLQLVGPLLFGTVACATIYWARCDLRSPTQRFVAPHEPIDRSLANIVGGCTRSCRGRNSARGYSAGLRRGERPLAYWRLDPVANVVQGRLRTCKW